MRAVAATLIKTRSNRLKENSKPGLLNELQGAEKKKLGVHVLSEDRPATGLHRTMGLAPVNSLL